MIERLMSLLIVLAIATGLAVLAQNPSHEWSYGGPGGPENWSNLNRAFHDCLWGHTQSPIDIWGASKKPLPSIEFDYHETPLRIINNGHSIQVNYAPGSWITVGEDKYELKEFHFHHPSEEHIGGQVYSMSIHLVHRNEQGKIAVVAVLLTHAGKNQALQKIWDHMPKARGPEQQVTSVTVNAVALVPKTTGYYTFLGSLTTPPCTEGVTWFVLKTPVAVSDEQIAAFAALYPNNARPIEPTGLRTISESSFD